ncbi:hypothetical protein QYF36_025774 [Acer negundo]|nr:hypothetical protein QYF36_025774 [Acer negundo]
MMDSASSSAANSQFSDVGEEVVVENPNGQISRTPPCLKEFNFEDLKTATSNFKPEALLGEGVYGRVYKGWIDEKTLTPSEWGTGNAIKTLSWDIRLKIAIGAARDRPSMKEVMEVLVQIQAMTFMKKVPEELEQIKVMDEKPKKSKFSSPRCSIAPPRHSQPHCFITSLKASCQYVSLKTRKLLSISERVDTVIDAPRLAVSTPNPASAPPFCSPTSTNVNIQQQFQVHLTIKKMLATPHLKEFSFKELKMATRNFSAQLGSLDTHLFRRNSDVEPLSWDIRLKIAIGAARGLTFLHTLEKKVIYRDFKTYNIMHDENYNAKLSNLGLATLGPSSEKASVPTVIAGTIGYIAPECITAGDLYLKSDVYGFGVVLLKLLMGLRVIDPKHPCRQQNLFDWLKSILFQKMKLKTIMDMQMEGQYSFEAALQAAQLSLRCLELDPRSRPSMKEVMEVLREIEALASHLHE